MAEFTPRELDQLEDALEGLEDVEDLSTLGLDEALSGRLDEYQQVLSLSREALPLEEVPEGLLDGVLAEARESRATQQPSVSLWDRWRRTLIPAFALAGTAAAVLLIVRPDEDITEATATPDPPAPASAAEAEEVADESPSAVAPAVVEESKPAEEPEPELDAEQAAAPMPAPAKEAPKREKADDYRGAKDAVADQKANMAPVQQEALEEPLDKDDAWELVEKAAGLTKAGRCSEARPLYNKLAATATDNALKARIQVGLGVCREADQGDPGAHFSNAEALDANIKPYMDDMREATKFGGAKQGKPAAKKKRKSKQSPDTNAYQGE